MPRGEDQPNPASYLDGYTTGENVGRMLGYVEGHHDGYDRGYEDGRAEALAEVETEWSAFLDGHNRRLVAAVASRPDRATLSERRGEPERAEATRRLWRERGIA